MSWPERASLLRGTALDYESALSPATLADRCQDAIDLELWSLRSMVTEELMRIGLQKDSPVKMAGRLSRDKRRLTLTPVLRSSLVDWSDTAGNDPWWYATVRPYFRGMISEDTAGRTHLHGKITVARYAVSGLAFFGSLATVGVLLLIVGLVMRNGLLWLGLGCSVPGIFFGLLIWWALPVSRVGHTPILRWMNEVLDGQMTADGLS